MDKRRIIKGFDNLDAELKKAFEELYPEGYKDYKDKVFRLTNAKNENFFVAPMETEDAIYLVKVELDKPKDEEEEYDEPAEDEGTSKLNRRRSPTKMITI